MKKAYDVLVIGPASREVASLVADLLGEEAACYVL